MSESNGILAHLVAMARLRCPRCLNGKVFKALLDMNDPCPKCGLVFQREEGYFLGAMYVSYVLGGLLVALAWVVASYLFPLVHPFTMCVALFLLYIPLMPFMVRYSRVIWLHFDRTVCPGDTAAGSYQKSQERVTKP